jgi:hypothetical protein
MMLPSWWRRPAFGVAEAAGILCVPEDTLRTWMAREPTGQYIGARTGGRVYLSGKDIYFYSLVREFTAYGVAVRTSMHVADGIASFSGDAMPPDKFIVIRRRSTVSEFEQTDNPDLESRPATVIPLRKLAEVMIERAGGVYATEAA